MTYYGDEVDMEAEPSKQRKEPAAVVFKVQDTELTDGR
jgi:hypothetical protein